MALWGKFFTSAKKATAVFDIGPESVGAAYLSEKDSLPCIAYSVREEVKAHDGEEPLAAMARALQTVCDRLIKEGAPALLRLTGAGSSSGAIVALRSPWQTTKVSEARIAKQSPFTFTRSIMKEAVITHVGEELAPHAEVIATMLNGYRVQMPFGKKISKADIVIAASTFDEEAVKSARDIIKGSLHTRSVRFATLSWALYAAFGYVFPHEKNYLIVAGNASADVLFMADGILADARATAGKASIIEALGEFAKSRPLPRLVFSLEQAGVPMLKEALGDTSLSSLWLTDERTVVPIQASQLSGFVKTGPEAVADPALMLIALFHAKGMDGVDA